MNSQKKIEVNQSSLLGLKAELLRKKNEVNNAKYAQEVTNVTVIKKKLTTKLDKSNEGVNEREKRDAEEIEEENDQLKKSQNILIEKAKLYEKLTSNASDVDPGINTEGFLVNFKEKNNEELQSEEINKQNEDKKSEKSESDYGDYSEDEDEWVDFVDCLGRTKRCHKDDLKAMKEQDEKLKVMLHGRNKKEEKEEEKEKKEGNVEGIKLPQLCSEDMKRELLREKWEEQERKLLEKKDVHYQDLLFDEARTHGVGYFGFSTDEEERARQQEELRQLRKETKQQQAQTQIAALRKQKQKEERLKAARKRKRERLGLPPEEEEPEVTETKEEPKPEPPEELRRDVRKPAPLRPWDLGKEKTAAVLSQDEWIEKKRAERPEEFAPPSFENKKRKQFPHKKEKRMTPEVEREKEIQNEETDELLPSDFGKSESCKKFKNQFFPGKWKQKNFESEPDKEEVRGRGVEIPPPPVLETSGLNPAMKKAFSQKEIDKSIEEGLNFLRKKVEEKQAKKRRIDDIEIL